MPYLMNKEHTAAEIELDKAGTLAKCQIINERYCPLPIVAAQKKPAIEKVQQTVLWFRNRMIPNERIGFADANMNALGDIRRKVKHFASLSDQYWVRYSKEKWEEINFRNNKYPDTTQKLLFGDAYDNGDLETPDITTAGISRKTWIQNEDFTSTLIKHKGNASDPIRNITYTITCDGLGMPLTANKKLMIYKSLLCCAEENFVSSEEEYIPMYQVIYYTNAEGGNIYDKVVDALSRLGITGGQQWLDNVRFVDALTGNFGRTLSNIGVIRNIETGNYRTAPVTGNGSAFKKTGRNPLFGESDQLLRRKLGEYSDELIDGIKKQVQEIYMTFPEWSPLEWGELKERAQTITPRIR